MGVIDNFIKGLRLGANLFLGSFNINKIFKQIVYENSFTLITILTLNCMKDGIGDIVYYPSIFTFFVINSCFNILNTLNLCKLLIDKYKQDSLDLSTTSVADSIKIQITFLFYYKIHYLLDLLFLYLVANRKIVYYGYALYFYGRYIVDIYLGLRNVAVKNRDDYIIRLNFYLLGIGTIFLLLTESITYVIRYISNPLDIFTLFIIEDIVFTLVYSLLLVRLEKVELFPEIEPERPIIFMLNKDIVEMTICNIFNWLRKKIKNKGDKLRYLLYLRHLIPWKLVNTVYFQQFLELHRLEIGYIVDNVIWIKCYTDRINTELIKTSLSLWFNRDIIGLGLKLLQLIDKNTWLRLKAEIQNINPNLYFKEEDRGVYSYVTVDFFEGLVYTRQIKSKSPTINRIHVIDFEESHFK